MNEAGVRVSTLLLQYWYQLRNAVPMLSSIGTPVREEDGPAYLFSTLFASHLISREFGQRFALVPWMTYRSNFEALDGGFTTDCGWGCMLRSAQMMLAETLMRRECAQGSSVASHAVRERVLRLFHDRKDCPYSLHEMSRRAAAYGKVPGEWFEPTLTLLVVKEMLSSREDQDHLRAIVARDGLLDASSIVSPGATLRTDDDIDPLLRPPTQTATSVLLLVPLRLGLRELNEKSYGEALIRALRFPQSVGMVGGKPGHSLYFCGSQGRKIVFLDPHTVQTTQSCSDLRTFQCPDARCMPVGEIDPSLALGFLVSSLEDFMDLKMRIETLPGPALFSISTTPVDYEGGDADFDDEGDGEEDDFPPSHSKVKSPLVARKSNGEEDDDDEFEQVKAPSSPSMINSGAVATSSSAAVNPPVLPASSAKKADEFVFL